MHLCALLQVESAVVFVKLWTAWGVQSPLQVNLLSPVAADRTSSGAESKKLSVGFGRWV